MTTPSTNSNQPASAHSPTRRSGAVEQPASVGVVPSTVPVELAAFLDLVAELIAAVVWQGTHENTVPGEDLTAQPDGQGAPPASEAGNDGPIPNFPADSHPHSRSSPTAPRRGTRRVPPKEAS